MYYVQNLRVILVLFARKVAKKSIETRSCWRSRKFINPTYACLTYTRVPSTIFRCAKICRLLFLRSFPVRLSRPLRLPFRRNPPPSLFLLSYIAARFMWHPNRRGIVVNAYPYPSSNCAEKRIDSVYLEYTGVSRRVALCVTSNVNA